MAQIVQVPRFQGFYNIKFVGKFSNYPVVKEISML
jgi:hypothetical protein